MADIDDLAEDDFFEDGDEEDDVGVDDGDFDCHGHFYGGVFTCGAARSECEFECPNNGLIGLTPREAEELDEE